VTDGWFVVNVRDAAWVTNEHFGAACIFEGDDAPFAQLGFTIGVLRRGQTGGLYHREASQEDFLVLAGECLLLIEGEERPLQAWDFVHCPPETEHIFVGIGERPLRPASRQRQLRRPRRTRLSRSGSPDARRAGPGCRGRRA